MLYERKFLPQNKKTEEQILNKNHPLSSDFEATGYIVLDEIGTIVSRCVLTFYSGDTNSYVGFFESKNSLPAVRCLFDSVIAEARKQGKTKLVGPLDCSFWIKYRFKTNCFDNYYSGEPYNLPYYEELWKNIGFQVSERYYSNQLKVPEDKDTQRKTQSRLELMLKKGYEFKHPTRKSFNGNLDEIYELITKVYSKFPMYKNIDREQFIELFKNLKYILNNEMVHLAYKDGKLAGFLICIPNYRNTNNIFKMLRIRKNPDEYIILYMGAGPEHIGLGGAFSELVKRHLQKNKCTSVAALIHEGNLSGSFYKNLRIEKYEYDLMELVI